MNNIPVDGMIIYTFPIEYKLDSICRVMKGLTAKTGGSISCTAVDNVVTITDFDFFNS